MKLFVTNMDEILALPAVLQKYILSDLTREEKLGNIILLSTNQFDEKFKDNVKQSQVPFHYLITNNNRELYNHEFQWIKTFVPDQLSYFLDDYQDICYLSETFTSSEKLEQSHYTLHFYHKQDLYVIKQRLLEEAKTLHMVQSDENLSLILENLNIQTNGAIQFLKNKYEFTTKDVVLIGNEVRDSFGDVNKYSNELALMIMLKEWLLEKYDKCQKKVMIMKRVESHFLKYDKHLKK